MKLTSLNPIGNKLSRICAVFMLALLGVVARAGDGGYSLSYNPSVYNVNGQAPLNVWLTPNNSGVGRSMTVVAPGNVTTATPITITATPTSYPAGVTLSQALSYVTLSASQITVAPGGSISFDITLNIPQTGAGDYVYRINTTGWPSDTEPDQGVFINAHAPPPLSPIKPTIAISSPANLSAWSYTFPGSVTVPISSAGMANSVSPISLLVTTVTDPQGQNVNIDSWRLTGIASSLASGSGSVTLSKPGIYTVNANTANVDLFGLQLGIAVTSIQFTVNENVTAPTVAITAPTVTSYTYENGSPAPTVDFGFVGTSFKGGITALSATLDGAPFTFTAAGITAGNVAGNGPFTATGTRTGVTVPVVGTTTDGSSVTETHRFAVTATDSYGTAGVSPIVYQDFTVTKTYPAPTLVITSPAAGTVVTRTSTSTPFSLSYAFDAAIKTGNAISTISDTISGPATITLTKTGEGTTAAHGSGVITSSTAGFYTLTATTTANGYVVTKSVQVEFRDPVSLPKPTVKITTLGNTTGVLTPSFTYVSGSGSLSIPFALLGTSQATAGITSLVTKVDGVAVSVTYAGGTAVGKTSAPGTGTIVFAAPTSGSHVISADIVDANGAASDSFTFTINIVTPVPKLTITAPTDGSTYNHIIGAPALQIPFTFVTSVTPSPAVMKTHAATIAFNGGTATTLTLTNTNLNTANASGASTLSLTAAGTYVITATGTTNYGQVVTGKVTIKVTESQPAPACTTTASYAGEIACGTVIDINTSCNRNVDFSFQLKTCCTTTTNTSSNCYRSSCGDRDTRRGDCYRYSNCSKNDGYRDDDDDDDGGSCGSSTSNGCTTTKTCVNVCDKSVKVLISEVYSNGTLSSPLILSYGSCTSTSNYSIDYNKNYKISYRPYDTGCHRYRMSIYMYAAGSNTPTLVGTKDFATK